MVFIAGFDPLGAGGRETVAALSKIAPHSRLNNSGSERRHRLSVPMKHILLLQDDTDVSCMLVGLLEADGYYVNVATRAADASELLGRVAVDLLIADVLLQGGTTFAAIDAAKERQVPYLVITGSAAHMAQLAANHELYLAKPFNIAEFINAVRSRIGPADGAGRT